MKHKLNILIYFNIHRVYQVKLFVSPGMFPNFETKHKHNNFR